MRASARLVLGGWLIVVGSTGAGCAPIRRGSAERDPSAQQREHPPAETAPASQQARVPKRREPDCVDRPRESAPVGFGADEERAARINPPPPPPPPGRD